MEREDLEKEISKYCIIRSPDEIKENISEIIGLEIQKKTIQNIIDAAKNFTKLEKAGLNSNLSALLYGLPGVGKTFLTRAICQNKKAILIEVQPSTIFESHFGETLKNITSFFTHIGKYANLRFKEGKPTVLFIDEFDSLARERADPTEIGEMKRAVNELLRGIDSLMYGIHPLVIIAATNHESTLDSAVWRRFLYHIHFPLPNLEVRKEILNYFLNKLESIEPNFTLDLNINHITEQLEGFSPSDIERLVRSIYIEYLSSPTRDKFIIDNEKAISAISYIGGTQKHMKLSNIDKQSEKVVQNQKTKSLSISDLLKQEVEKTKKGKG